MRSQGSRLAWRNVPEHIRNDVAAMLGSAVVAAENEAGGFSPGVAARCRLADGRRCFVKAVSAVQNPDSPGMHRREGRVASHLPAGLPVPALLGVIDDSEWVVLVFEEITGQPPRLPWTRPDLVATFAALRDLSTATTPCPVPGLPSFAQRHGEMFACYRRLAEGHPTIDLIDPWSRAHLDRLAALEGEWEGAAAGDALVHADVRADNLLLRPDGAVVVVDWPHACVGAPWVDVACMLPSVGLDGGPSPIEIERDLNPLAGVDPDALNRVLVGLAGYFTFQGLQLDPVGLPTVRAFQRAQGQVARSWLAHRLGLLG